MINLLWIKRSASQPFFIGDSWDTLLGINTKLFDDDLTDSGDDPF